MITRITKENVQCFENMIPTDMLEQMDVGLYHFLGAVHVENGENYAAGVLVFCLEDMICDSVILQDLELTPEEEEDLSSTGHIVSTIKWLFVDPKYRKKGYCSELIQNYFDCMDEAEIDIAVCDVPDDEEYDELVEVLAHWSFAFSEAELFLYENSLQSISESISKIKVPKSLYDKYRIRSLREEKSSTFARILDMVRNSDDLIDPDFSESIDSYEQKLSLVAYRDEKLIGVLLVRKFKSGILQPILLKNTVKDVGDSLLLLLSESVKEAKKLYEPDTFIRINCLNEETALLIDRLFDDARAVAIRRGVSIPEFIGENENG